MQCPTRDRFPPLNSAKAAAVAAPILAAPAAINHPRGLLQPSCATVLTGLAPPKSDGAAVTVSVLVAEATAIANMAAAAELPHVVVAPTLDNDCGPPWSGRNGEAEFAITPHKLR